MVRYGDHAEFQIARRGIAKAWIVETLERPDQVESHKTRRSFLKCLPGRRVMLSVVTPDAERDFVITAYFDRTKPCV